MNIEQVPLLTLVEQFLRKDFSFDEARKLLGPTEEETGLSMLLKPRPESNVESAGLEKVMLVPNGPPFLGGMVIDWKRLVYVDFGDLKKRFGPEEIGTRLKPTSTPSYLFRIKGDDYEGCLIL